MTEAEIEKRYQRLQRIYIEHPRLLKAQQAILDLGLRRNKPAQTGADEAAGERTSDQQVVDEQVGDGMGHLGERGSATDPGRTDAKSAGDGARCEGDADDDQLGNSALSQHCVIVCGPSGSGKSTLAARIAAMPQFQPAFGGPDGDIVPLIRFDMPNTPTPKALLEEVCQQAGLALPRKITRNELARRLRNQLKELGTVLIMIDESHTMAEWKSDEAVMEMARTLKFVLNLCGVPIVLLGEPALRRLAEYPALLRRTEAYISLDAYNWSDEDQRFQFFDLVDQLDEALGFAKLSGLAQPDVASRLYYVCRGHIGLVVKYLAMALKLALRANHKAIDAKLLAAAYRELHPLPQAVLPDPDMLVTAGANPDPFSADRAAFKKMWAARFSGADDNNTSSIAKRRRQPKQPANVLVS